MILELIIILKLFVFLVLEVDKVFRFFEFLNFFWIEKEMSGHIKLVFS